MTDNNDNTGNITLSIYTNSIEIKRKKRKSHIANQVATLQHPLFQVKIKFNYSRMHKYLNGVLS